MTLRVPRGTSALSLPAAVMVPDFKKVSGLFLSILKINLTPFFTENKPDTFSDTFSRTPFPAAFSRNRHISRTWAVDIPDTSSER
jgi:hypothetical protein